MPQSRAKPPGPHKQPPAGYGILDLPSGRYLPCVERLSADGTVTYDPVPGEQSFVRRYQAIRACERHKRRIESGAAAEPPGETEAPSSPRKARARPSKKGVTQG